MNEASDRKRSKRLVAASAMLVLVKYDQIIYIIVLDQTFCNASEPIAKVL